VESRACPHVAISCMSEAPETSVSTGYLRDGTVYRPGTHRPTAVGDTSASTIIVNPAMEPEHAGAMEVPRHPTPEDGAIGTLESMPSVGSSTQHHSGSIPLGYLPSQTLTRGRRSFARRQNVTREYATRFPCSRPSLVRTSKLPRSRMRGHIDTLGSTVRKLDYQPSRVGQSGGYGSGE